jgi:hypothetical protein
VPRRSSVEHNHEQDVLGVLRGAGGQRRTRGAARKPVSPADSTRPIGNLFGHFGALATSLRLATDGGLQLGDFIVDDAGDSPSAGDPDDGVDGCEVVGGTAVVAAKIPVHMHRAHIGRQPRRLRAPTAARRRHRESGRCRGARLACDANCLGWWLRSARAYQLR